MRKILFLLLAAGLMAGSLYASDNYWISIGTGSDDPVRLMQIDASGKVLVPPTDILTRSQTGNNQDRLTAMAPGPDSGSLFLWVLSENESDEYACPIYRAIVAKNSLQVLSLRKVSILASGAKQSFHATQSGRSFLAFMLGSKGKGTTFMKGAEVGADGMTTGLTWNLSPRTGKETDQGGVSSDGRVGFVRIDPTTDNLDEVYVTPLKANGLPAGDPTVIVKRHEVEEIDATNMLSGNRRFVVYLDDQNSLLFLQVVDGTTLAKQGPVKLIASPDVDADDQILAIDPLGRFVIYLQVSSSCSGSDIMYLALDANGNPAGNPKAIASPCSLSPNYDAFEGIDLLLEQ